ncbi:MAG: hypothetical protein KKH98_08775 [Spirochaetes bacterium]|nr:hypothetical protein [Spirochaetota bacterium]
MRKVFLLIIFLVTSSFGADFQPQHDTYFGPERTKIIWSLGSGLGAGSAHGYLGMNNGFSGELEFLRLVGEVDPENRYVKYLWLTLSEYYSLYEDENNFTEFILGQVNLGIGLNLNDKGVFKNVIPYFGGGMGFGMSRSSFDITSDDPYSVQGDWLTYSAVGGLEYRATKMIVFFVETKYLWGSLLSDMGGEDSNYIPDAYSSDGDDSGGGNNSRYQQVADGYTFARDEVEIRQLTVRAGLRFYWGQDMFWFYPFFWEK